MADLTQNINYLQPTSYKLTIDRQNYPNLEYFAQTVTHPGMIMNPVEMPYSKVTGVPFLLIERIILILNSFVRVFYIQE